MPGARAKPWADFASTAMLRTTIGWKRSPFSPLKVTDSSASTICTRSLADLLLTPDTVAFAFTVLPVWVAWTLIAASGATARCAWIFGSTFDSKSAFALSALPPPPSLSPSKK